MIVNFKNINLSEILIYIYNNKTYSIIIKYWKKFYFLAKWLNFYLFSYNYKILYVRYQTQYHLNYIFWKFFKKYFNKKNTINYVEDIHNYIEIFIKTKIIKNKSNIILNNSKLQEYINYNQNLIIEFDNFVNYSYNFYSLKYLNICY